MSLESLGDERLPGQSFDVIFSGEPVNDHQMDSEFAGRMLLSVQALLRAIVGGSRNPRASSRHFSAEVRASSRLWLAEVFPGSFGMRLEAVQEEPELTGLSAIANDLEKMVDLIGASDGEEELLRRVAIVGPLGAKSYEEVLQSISSAKATVTFRWPRVSGVLGGRVATNPARNALAVLRDVGEETDGHYYVGLLDTASRRRGRFGFTATDGEVFDGDVEQDIMDSLRDYYDRQCKVYIVTRTVTHRRTGAIQRYHRLQELTEPDPVR